MSDASALRPRTAALTQQRPADQLIWTLAECQHGVVARRQLLQAGVTRHEVAHRIGQGRLHVVHRGVYAVGHRILTKEGRWHAAVLAAGADAVLSHRSAAALWQLLASDRLEVTTRRSRRPLSGIAVRRSALPPDEVGTRRGIPVTSVPRTLLDLAAVVPEHQVERALNEAEMRGHCDKLSLPDLVARYPRRAGMRSIKAILERVDDGPTATRSELEARFLSFLRDTGLPPPEVNADVLGAERDFVWRGQRLVVELDGHEAHRTRAAFEGDRARDRALTAAGWRTIRITWRQLQQDAQQIAADLRSAVHCHPSPPVASPSTSQGRAEKI